MTVTDVSLVDAYRGRGGLFPMGDQPGWDEMTGAGDQLLPGWSDVADALDRIGPGGLTVVSSRVERLLEDGGVTYVPVTGTPDGPTVPPRQWPLDPVPLVVDGADWATLEAGLIQRSTLLDLLLTDIYGARAILERGLVPPELVFGHEHYLRAAHGITIPGAHQLFFHAVDLCRGPDGHFLAVSDRAQAPSGSGYAMAGRRVVSRVLPDAFRHSAPRGLASFFHTVRGALQSVAPTSADDPRVVVLSPGSLSETAFDQAFLASLLGVPLVESADLTVRGGQLWMRALGRYEPVHVVLRRVDAQWSDPLDLRAGSQLGVVGLTEACRRGTVSVVNTLGSGVVENPGLLPLLPALCRELLSEDLLLPSLPTFWCGEPASLSHVLANFSSMVLRPTGVGTAVTPALLPAAEQDTFRRRIVAEPQRWVGQTPAPFSQAPTVAGARLAPRRVGLRAFVVAHESGYVVMPGALGRVVRDPLSTAGPGGAGDTADQLAGQVAAKDVWVKPLRVEPASRAAPRLDASGLLLEPIQMAAAASPRVLEDMFWLGRYAERTEDLTRLLITTRELADTFRYRGSDLEAGSVRVLFDAVTEVSATGLAFTPGTDPMGRMRQVLLDPAIPGTVAQSLAGLQETARSVRDQLSGDTWMVLAAVDRAMARLDSAKDDNGQQLQATHAALLSGMLALSGLASENMVRDPGWQLMEAGRRLERAQQLAALMRATLAVAHPPEVEAIVIDSVLAAAESGVTYRRRYRGRMQVGTVLELLVLDAGNPRALAYQIDALAASLRALPDAAGTSRPERLTEDLAALLRRADPAELDAEEGGRRLELATFLTQMHDSLRALADAIAAQHFWHSRPMLPLGPHHSAAR